MFCKQFSDTYVLISFKRELHMRWSLIKIINATTPSRACTRITDTLELMDSNRRKWRKNCSRYAITPKLLSRMLQYNFLNFMQHRILNMIVDPSLYACISKYHAKQIQEVTESTFEQFRIPTDVEALVYEYL